MPNEKEEPEEPCKLAQHSNKDLEISLENSRTRGNISNAENLYGIRSLRLDPRAGNTIWEPDPALTPTQLYLENLMLSEAIYGLAYPPEAFNNHLKVFVEQYIKFDPLAKSRSPDEWLNIYLKRHPMIQHKLAEIDANRQASSKEKEDLTCWFEEVKSHLSEVGLLTRPESIFSGAETKFSEFFVTSVRRETLNVFFAFSATGAKLPAMIIFNYKRLPDRIVKELPQGWYAATSDTGSMNSVILFEYISCLFYPWCIQNNITFPVVFFTDAYRSHWSKELQHFCTAKRIILHGLLPKLRHSEHQAIYNELKLRWLDVVQEPSLTLQGITKVNFASILKKALDRVSVDCIRRDFELRGLYPCNGYADDLRRYSGEIPPELQEDRLTPVDLLSTARFFRHVLGWRRIAEYSMIRSLGGSSEDPVYLLWEKCLHGLHVAAEMLSKKPIGNAEANGPPFPFEINLSPEDLMRTGDDKNHDQYHDHNRHQYHDQDHPS